MFSKFLLVFIVKQDKVLVFTIYRYTVPYCPYLGTEESQKDLFLKIFVIKKNEEERLPGWNGGP
jgi:hypothetical protein